MHQNSTYHRLASLGGALAALLGAWLPLSAHAANFPPLNDPATREAHPGKFVWAELFTADSAAATRFYTGVFGWTAYAIHPPRPAPPAGSAIFQFRIWPPP